VLLPNGKPAPNAEVVLLAPGQYVGLGRGALRAYQAQQEGLLVHTGPDGHFTFASSADAKAIIAVDEDGYANIPLDKFKAQGVLPQIALEAWGRIEGTVRVGRHPGTNELVTIESDHAPGPLGPMFEDFEARTDDQGRFVFTFVPPGERKIARMIPKGSGSWQHSPPTYVTVKPGAVTSVVVGGNGRKVVGKVQLIDPPAAANWQHTLASLHTPFPKPLNKLKDAAQQQAWLSSPEYQSLLKPLRSYPLSLSDDGSFHADEVPPGKYELDIGFTMTDSPQGMFDYVGRFHQAVSVPEPKDKDDDSPVDLGTISGKLEPMPVLAADQQAK
jgi:hypothetical protein